MAGLYGEITNTTDGQPLPNVLITIERTTTPIYKVYSNKSGQYTTVIALEPGWYNITFEKAGFSSFTAYQLLNAGFNLMNVGLAFLGGE